MSTSPLMNLTVGLASELEKPTVVILIDRRAGQFGVAHAVAGLTAQELEGAIGSLLGALANAEPDHTLCPDCAARPDRARAALAQLNVPTVPPRASTH